jgi:AraC-like DNA-binding protein
MCTALANTASREARRRPRRDHDAVVGVTAGKDAVRDATERAVGRAIAAMHDNLGELLSIDDMAQAAMFSKFHFTRIFQRTTGVSPGRFLSAVRLQKAQQLLVTTSLKVADISIQVGYNSVGTFSSRFTRSVGVSPTAFRRLGGFTAQPQGDVASAGAGVASGTVLGDVWSPPGSVAGRVFVGLFPNWMPEGRPARCTVLDGAGRFTLDRVPDGVWYVLSHSVCAPIPDDTLQRPSGGPELCVGAFGPVTIRRGTAIQPADLQLRPIGPMDPPVLLALAGVRHDVCATTTVRS